MKTELRLKIAEGDFQNLHNLQLNTIPRIGEHLTTKNRDFIVDQVTWDLNNSIDPVVVLILNEI